jgi:hypothetical protein
MRMIRLVLHSLLLLLPVSGICDEENFERSVAIQFEGFPDNLDINQITVLEEAFDTAYNGLSLCISVDAEIVAQHQRRRLQFFEGFYLDFRALCKCRGCPEDSNLFTDDAVRRSLAQELIGSGQERSLQDSTCAPCEMPTSVDFIAQFNTILSSLLQQDNALANAVAVSMWNLEESLAQGVCENFAVHARTTISFNGEPTTIHGGDVGLSPGTSVAGAYQFQDGGEFVDNSSDFAALTVPTHAAKMAVRTGAIALGVEIGGSTFTPGTYRSGSAINIASGTVITLDGEGDPNSVFLFQAVTTLITGASTSVILTNGARAENVVWVLGTAATLGASSVVEGSILAGTAITFGIKSELRGCALAQTFVTFESEGSIKPTH